MRGFLIVVGLLLAGTGALNANELNLSLNTDSVRVEYAQPRFSQPAAAMGCGLAAPHG